MTFWRSGILAGLCAIITIHVSPLCKADVHTPPPPFFAKVESVTASNSLMVVRDGGDRVQVVLAFLSIPKLNQAYGKRAADILRAQLVGRRVSVRPIGEPKEPYVNGIVYVGENNFNLDFLRRGHAWLDYYQVAHPAWRRAQQSARAAGRGLYADPTAMHPIDWNNQLQQASRLFDVTSNMAKDPEINHILANTYIGHRKDKVYVQADCYSVWANWPDTAWVPITTKAGAAADGYTEQPCK